MKFKIKHYDDVKKTVDAMSVDQLYTELAEDAVKIQNAYLTKLKDDISWFCKKFDYNYENEPWYDSKDAVERAIRFLSGNVDLK